MWANALGTDPKADKFQFGSKELTLRRLRIEAFGFQNGKYLVQMNKMLLRCFGMDNQVIQVDEDKRATAVKIMSIVPWNVAGALHRPKGITLN